MINALREHDGRQQLTLEEAVATGELEYIAFPEALKGKYPGLHAGQPREPAQGRRDVEFRTVQEGTREYMQNLLAAFPNVEE